MLLKVGRLPYGVDSSHRKLTVVFVQHRCP
jgi:hypothetical protein